MSPRRTPPDRAKAFKTRARKRLARKRRAVDLAFQLLLEARCGDAMAIWTEAEHAYRISDTIEEEQHAAETVLWRCRECPVLDLCREWAMTDRYTGLAAGTHWTDGKPTTKPIAPPVSEANAA